MHTAQIEKVVYIGGAPEPPSFAEGTLCFLADEISFESRGYPPLPGLSIIWPEVTAVDVSDATIAKSKIGAVAAFGVLGLAAKGSESGSSIEITLRSGDHVFFCARKTPLDRSRAILLPILQDHRVGADLTAAGGADMTGVEALERLAKLHADGALTDDEFTAAKAKFLGF